MLNIEKYRDELIKMGVKEGDSVKIADWELEWY